MMGRNILENDLVSMKGIILRNHLRPLFARVRGLSIRYSGIPLVNRIPR